jgi:hypothetical protein
MDDILTNVSATAAAEAWLRDFGAALASGEAAADSQQGGQGPTRCGL